jgi:hypothetical protein
MTQTIVKTKPNTPVVPVAIASSLEQIICIHPQAETAPIVYEFIATVAHKDSLKRYKALVISPVASLTSINRAIQETLGDRWFCTAWEVAV